MKEDGFTLIEALVALALGVAVVTVVLSTVRIASVSAARSGAAVAEAEGFAQAGMVLAGDARHAVLRQVEGKVLFSGGARVVEFPAIGRVSGQDVLLRYDLSDLDLRRAEAPLLDSGKAGIFAPPQVIWHAAARAEFRFLAADGGWQRDWVGEGLPRAFGLATLDGGHPQLVAAFPDLIEAECGQGPGEGCSLAAEAFP